MRSFCCFCVVTGPSADINVPLDTAFARLPRVRAWFDQITRRTPFGGPNALLLTKDTFDKHIPTDLHLDLLRAALHPRPRRVAVFVAPQTLRRALRELDGDVERIFVAGDARLLQTATRLTECNYVFRVVIESSVEPFDEADRAAPRLTLPGFSSVFSTKTFDDNRTTFRLELLEYS
jgi:hypothetical protein